MSTASSRRSEGRSGGSRHFSGVVRFDEVDRELRNDPVVPQETGVPSLQLSLPRLRRPCQVLRPGGRSPLDLIQLLETRPEFLVHLVLPEVGEAGTVDVHFAKFRHGDRAHEVASENWFQNFRGVRLPFVPDPSRRRSSGLMGVDLQLAGDR